MGKKGIFRSEIGSGFGELGGTSLPPPLPFTPGLVALLALPFSSFNKFVVKRIESLEDWLYKFSVLWSQIEALLKAGLSGLTGFLSMKT